MTVRNDILDDSLTEQDTILVQRVMSAFRSSTQSSVDCGVERTSRPAKDIDDLPDLISQVLEDKQNDEGIDSNQRVKFYSEMPPKDVVTEVITFGLVRREPASMTRGGPFTKERIEWKPRIREVAPHPTMPGMAIVVQGQQFENEISLTCWTKTNKRADYRARWLEDTLHEYMWFLKFNGLHEMIFLGQGEDMVVKLDNTENVLMGRPLRWYVRTERLTHVNEPTIRRLIIQARLELQSGNNNRGGRT